MKNLKIKALIGIIVAASCFGFGTMIKNSMVEEPYSVGWKSWDVTADVLENGDMVVNEKLVYFNHTGENFRVSESLISFEKGGVSVASENDVSNLKEGSFTVDVYKDDHIYFSDQNIPTENAYYQGAKNGDCIGFSWFENCYDERGLKINKESGMDKVFIYLEDGLSNGLTIEFNYVIENVITKFSDYSVLNWKFQGAYDYADNKNVSLTINLPEGGEILTKNISNVSFAENEMTVMGFGTTNAKIDSQSGSQIKASAKKLYSSYNDEIEMFVSIPNNKVDLFSGIKEGDTNYSSTNGYLILKGIIDDALEDEEAFYKPYKFVEAIIIGIAVIGITINIIIVTHSYKKYDKELTSQFDYEYYREIPNASYSPSVASYLVNEQKLDKNSLNAELMDLIRRKYIIIDTNGQTLTDRNPNYIMYLNRELFTSGVGLTKSEKFLLNWFFNEIGKDGQLSFNELDEYMKNHTNAERYYKSNTDWNEKVYEESRKKNWFDKVNNAKKFLIFGLVSVIGSVFLFFQTSVFNTTWISVLFISLLAGSGVMVASYVTTIKRKTQEGVDEYTKWIAFKKFLEEFSTFEDYPVPSLIVWEHYMVYATMFGIADLVEKQLRTRFKDLQREEEYVSHPYFYYRYHHYFNYRIHNAQSIGKQAIAEYRSRQGGSGGRSGGFGGGSSFGGGGRGGSFR